MPKDERHAAGLFGKAAQQGPGRGARPSRTGSVKMAELDSLRMSMRRRALTGSRPSRVRRVRRLNVVLAERPAGLPKRPQEAALGSSIAAQQGIADGQEKLACLYEQGSGRRAHKCGDYLVCNGGGRRRYREIPPPSVRSHRIDFTGPHRTWTRGVDSLSRVRPGSYPARHHPHSRDAG